MRKSNRYLEYAKHSVITSVSFSWTSKIFTSQNKTDYANFYFYFSFSVPPINYHHPRIEVIFSHTGGQEDNPTLASEKKGEYVLYDVYFCCF